VRGGRIHVPTAGPRVMLAGLAAHTPPARSQAQPRGLELVPPSEDMPTSTRLPHRVCVCYGAGRTTDS
jgi:hypothetical protein